MREHAPLHGPYTWNVHGVCLNPTLVYNHNDRNSGAHITIASLEGRWYYGYDVHRKTGNYHGASSGCGSGYAAVGYATPAEAIKAGLDTILRSSVGAVLPPESYAHLLISKSEFPPFTIV